MTSQNNGLGISISTAIEREFNPHDSIESLLKVLDAAVWPLT